MSCLVLAKELIFIIILCLSAGLQYVDNHFKEYRPCGKLSSEEIESLKHQIIGLFIGKLCVVTRNSFDSIIVSAYFGLVVTAVYNNYYYIMNAVVAIMAIISASIIPGIGNSIATETVEKNYHDFMKFNFIFCWVTGCCTIFLACLYQPFMKMWVGRSNMFSLSSAILFAIYFFVLMIGNIRAAYTEAAGLWWENKGRAIFESVANLILNVVLGKVWGVNGVIVATILTTVIINFIMSSKIIYKYYFKNIKINEYFMISLFWVIATGISMIICLYINKIVELDGILELVKCSIICLCVSNTIFWVIFHKTKLYLKSKKWIVKAFER